MMMDRWRAIVAAGVLGVTIAALTGPAALAADANDRAQMTFTPTRAALTLIPGAQATQMLGEHRPAMVDPASQPEMDLLRECSNGEAQHAQASRFFFVAIVSQAWHILLHPLAVSVHDELAKYSRVSDATASADYYHAAESSGSNPPLNSRITCVRFIRYANADAGANSEEVALDFIASVRLDGPRDAIRLRPLRLYVGQSDAKSVNGRYSIAIALRADAVWRDQYAGHHDKLFEETLAKENIDLKPGPFLKYYPTESGSGVRVPIVPVSFGTDHSQDYGRAQFGVSVAELGVAPGTLKLLADMLPDPNEHLGPLIVTAAMAGAGVN